MSRTLRVCNLEDWFAGGKRKENFIQTLGDSLKDIGFFALSGHGISKENINASYETIEHFFNLDQTTKSSYENAEIARQRGYTPYGVEHAKDNPEPDLKEFWQTGRTLVKGHPLAKEFPQNFWPHACAPEFELHIDGLYNAMEKMSIELLKAASLFLNKEEDWLPSLARDGNTILRVIHYPKLAPDTPDGAVRSAQHEDINLITLLVGATADGLQVMDHDSTWIDVEGNHDHIIVDSGDMLQNLTNGLFKSTTHRVVNPPNALSDRYSMPMFVHPRGDVDLTPLPEFVAQTGGKALYPEIGADEYLFQRLAEIGLTS